jgi:hypothetical protein
MTVLVVTPGQGVAQRQLIRSDAEDAAGCLAITVRQGQLGGVLQEEVQHMVVLRQLLQVRG